MTEKKNSKKNGEGGWVAASDIKQWITKYILEQFDKMVILISPKMMSEMSIHGIIVSWQRKPTENY